MKAVRRYVRPERPSRNVPTSASRRLGRDVTGRGSSESDQRDELVAVREADVLSDLLAVLENQERGHGRNTDFLGNFL